MKKPFPFKKGGKSAKCTGKCKGKANCRGC
jgi:hypothetical protein